MAAPAPLPPLLRGELIGMKAKVIDSTNKDTVGIEGTIIDETLHTITIKTRQERKRLLKAQVTLEITGSGTSVVQGTMLLKRPEDRVRMKPGEQ